MSQIPSLEVLLGFSKDELKQFRDDYGLDVKLTGRGRTKETICEELLEAASGSAARLPPSSKKEAKRAAETTKSETPKVAAKVEKKEDTLKRGVTALTTETMPSEASRERSWWPARNLHVECCPSTNETATFFIVSYSSCGYSQWRRKIAEV